MVSYNEYEKQQLHKWLLSMTEGATLAVTLTFNKKKVIAYGIRMGICDKKKLIEATRSVGIYSLKYVREKYNRKVLGNNWQRKGLEGLKMASVIEYDKKGYAHWHIAVKAKLKDIRYISNYIDLAWQRTWLGGHENKFKIVDDRFGWTKYMSKHGTRAYIDDINTII